MKITVSDKTSNLTTKQFAVTLGVEYPEAQGLVKVLSKKGGLKVAGKIPPATGKGKPSIIYAFPTSFTISLDEVDAPASTEKTLEVVGAEPATGAA